jgi:hypothetical protein
VPELELVPGLELELEPAGHKPLRAMLPATELSLKIIVFVSFYPP